MKKKVQGMVQGNEADALNQNLRVLRRLKRATKVRTDRDLAELLGIEPQNITTAKKRRIPEKWIVAISKITGYSVSYFLSKTDDDDSGTQKVDTRQVGEPAGLYGHPNPGLGEAVNLLAEIIQSGDTPIIQALHSNLVAFREAVQSTGNVSRLQRENEELRARVAQLQARLDRSRIDTLEGRLENIENLYLNQVKKEPSERRGIMLELGRILGHDRNGQTIEPIEVKDNGGPENV